METGLSRNIYDLLVKYIKRLPDGYFKEVLGERMMLYQTLEQSFSSPKSNPRPPATCIIIEQTLLTILAIEGIQDTIGILNGWISLTRYMEDPILSLCFTINFIYARYILRINPNKGLDILSKLKHNQMYCEAMREIAHSKVLHDDSLFRGKKFENMLCAFNEYNYTQGMNYLKQIPDDQHDYRVELLRFCVRPREMKRLKVIHDINNLVVEDESKSEIPSQTNYFESNKNNQLILHPTVANNNSNNNTSTYNFTSSMLSDEEYDQMTKEAIEKSLKEDDWAITSGEDFSSSVNAQSQSYTNKTNSNNSSQLNDHIKYKFIDDEISTTSSDTPTNHSDFELYNSPSNNEDNYYQHIMSKTDEYHKMLYGSSNNHGTYGDYSSFYD
jgi:hypothetical protein